MRLQGFAVFLLLFVSIRFATAGTVTPVAVAPSDLQFSRPVMLQPTDFSKAPPGCGTIAKSALIARIGAGSAVRVAFDADTAAAGQFTCLRFDFTGAGKFSKVDTLGLTLQGNGAAAAGQIAPHTFHVQLHGRMIPVTVLGQVERNANGCFAYLYITTAVGGVCHFAGNSYPVRLINSDGSLHFGNKWQLISYKKGSDRIGKNGDVLVVTGSGKQALQGFYGQPMQVDGAWYTLQLNADASALTATPFTAPTGTLQFDYPCWETQLVGEKYYFALSGNSSTTTVPADNYRVAVFRGSPTPNSQQNGAWVTVTAANDGADIAVAPASKTHVGIGSGISASVKVMQNQRNIAFTLVFKDALGNDVVRLQSGRWPGCDRKNTLECRRCQRQPALLQQLRAWVRRLLRVLMGSTKRSDRHTHRPHCRVESRAL